MNKEISIPGLRKKKVKLKDLAVFSRQFATMINSGSSLLRLAQHPDRADREQGAGPDPGEVRNDIETGSSLSVAWPSTRTSSAADGQHVPAPARSAASSTPSCCSWPRTSRPRSSCAAR
jgi:hypothetical protein